MERLNAKIGPVGKLSPNADEPAKTEDLNLREACNKIIHALDVSFDFSEPESDDLGGLLPEVSLYGDKSGKPWKAILHIYRFIDGAHKVT
jgi:hypothetical protein